jgi:creatinine amidohydrolase
MKTLMLEQMTYPQIQRALEEGYRTVIVMSGSIEQHGPHGPVGADTYLGYMVGLALAGGLGDALLAPVIRPACSDHHLSFPGTISLPVLLYQQLVEAVCRSLSHHGFEKILLATMHGGNTRALRDLAPKLDQSLPCKVAFVDLIEDPHIVSTFNTVLAKLGVTPEEGGMHAGFLETAILLSGEAGHWVDMPAAEVGFTENVLERIQALAASGAWSIADISANGVVGDPRRATAEAGNVLVAELFPGWINLAQTALK